MKLINRVGYYLGGFSIGLILLAFFLSGKRASCSYGPQARVLKNISTKELLYSENAIQNIKDLNIDSLTISGIVKNGHVNFKKGNRDLDSCKIYVIESNHNNKDLSVTIENCEKIATINNVSLE